MAQGVYKIGKRLQTQCRRRVRRQIAAHGMPLPARRTGPARQDQEKIKKAV